MKSIAYPATARLPLATLQPNHVSASIGSRLQKYVQLFLRSKSVIISIVFSGLTVTVPTLAYAALILHGPLDMFVTQYVESIDPFNVTINGMVLNTGPVTLSL